MTRMNPRVRSVVASSVAWLSWLLLAPCAGGAYSSTVSSEDEAAAALAAERLTRRACKFRPLPRDVAEGFVGLHGNVHVSDVFSIPAISFSHGGHRIAASVPAGSYIGASVQVSFVSGVYASVSVETPSGEAYHCSRIVGAGGAARQCLLQRQQLPAGPLTIRIHAAGIGADAAAAEGIASPSSCVSVRLDLEITTSAELDKAESCARPIVAPPGLNSIGGGALDAAKVGPGGFVMRGSPGSALWRAPLSLGSDSFWALLTARVTFPSMVVPVQLLLEEIDTAALQLQSGDNVGSNAAQPQCRLRCFGGTPFPNGQALNMALPMGPSYILWLLAPSTGTDRCVSFDLTATLSRTASRALETQYLGPPPWLCEGSAWPSRLELLDASAFQAFGRGPSTATTSGDQGSGAILRAPRFALDDIFDLTRLPQCDEGACSDQTRGGLHSLELVVAVASILRLDVQDATVAARPVLLRGEAASAWQRLGDPNSRLPTLRTVPLPPGQAAGRQHTIHAELPPGKYTLVFVTEYAVGGLRSCASVRLRLELAPVGQFGVGVANAQPGACSTDLSPGFLAAQAARVKSSASMRHGEHAEMAEKYEVTLPRQSTFSTTGYEILASEDLEMQHGLPVLLRISVVSNFLEADLRVQVYATEGSNSAISAFAGAVSQLEATPVGEPVPYPDGNGYHVTVGPLSSQGKFKVVLYHVPRWSVNGVQFTCVRFAVAMTAIRAVSPGAGANVASVAALPGSGACDSAAPGLPTELSAVPGKPVILEGEFLLPSSGEHRIQLSSSLGAVLVRALASSPDAQVALGVGTPAPVVGGGAARVVGVLQDPSTSALILSTARLPTLVTCPTVRVHVVLLAASDATSCAFFQGAGGVGAGAGMVSSVLPAQLMEATAIQPGQEARLRSFTMPLPGAGLAVQVPINIEASVAELRLELGLEPPWLPVEIYLQEDPAGGVESEQLWSTAKPSGHRLAMLAPSLPRGRYILHVRSWGDIPALGSSCAQAMFSIALVEPEGHDTSNLRQEMLTSHDLHAVLPVPPALLVPTWLAPGGELVMSQMFFIGAEGARTTVTVEAPTQMRVIAEPANILTPALNVEVARGQVSILAASALTASSPIFLDTAGTYTISFKHGGGGVGDRSSHRCSRLCAENFAGGTCPCGAWPFFVTFGVADTRPRARDAFVQGSSCSSSAVLPPYRPPDGTQGGPSPHSWRRVDTFRVPAMRLITVPLIIARPSVVMVATWSQFVHNYIRIGLKADEGLWVGEQRSRLSALEIELPIGEYEIQVHEPTQPLPTSALPGTSCIPFGVLVSVAGFTPPPARDSATMQRGGWSFWPGFGAGSGAGGGDASWALGLGARCDGLGASPLPLDFLSARGGSNGLGGPVDGRGRLLVRHRMLLTDIHDGRKKAFFQLGNSMGSRSLFRVAVVSGDAEGLEAMLERANHAPLSPDRVWSYGVGWSMAWKLDGLERGYWLSFHREHRDVLTTGCASFELLVQLAPLSDVENMKRCPAAVVPLAPRAWIARALAQSAATSGSGSAGAGSPASPGGASGFDWVRATTGESFREAIDVAFDVPSLLEVEVAFNFLLSNVDLEVLGLPPALRARPTVGATGLPEDAVNARAMLQLRLPAGNYRLELRHAPSVAGLGDGTDSCYPLRLTIRHSPWSSNTGSGGFLSSLMGHVGGGASAPAVAIGPSVSAGPVALGTDLVVSAIGNDFAAEEDDSSGSPLPTLAGMAPTGAARHAGGLVAVWDRDVLEVAVATGKARQLPGAGAGGQNLWGLPLHFGGRGGNGGTQREVVIAAAGGAPLSPAARPPWSGGGSAGTLRDGAIGVISAESLIFPQAVPQNAHTHVKSNIETSVVGAQPPPWRPGAFNSGAASVPVLHPPAAPTPAEDAGFWARWLPMLLLATALWASQRLGYLARAATMARDMLLQSDLPPAKTLARFSSGIAVAGLPGARVGPGRHGGVREMPSVVEVATWASSSAPSAYASSSSSGATAYGYEAGSAGGAGGGSGGGARYGSYGTT